MEEAIDEAHRDLRCWMALGVRDRHEKPVAREIAARECEAFLPLCRIGRLGTITVPLFPGFVLCRLSFREAEEWMTTIPGITHVVMADRVGDSVVERELAALKAVQGSGLGVSPWTYSDSCRRVRVRHVGFPDIEGELVFADGAAKLVLSCLLLQRSIAADVRVEWLDVALPSPRFVQPPPEIHTFFSQRPRTGGPRTSSFRAT